MDSRWWRPSCGRSESRTPWTSMIWIQPTVCGLDFELLSFCATETRYFSEGKDDVFWGEEKNTTLGNLNKESLIQRQHPWKRHLTATTSANRTRRSQPRDFFGAAAAACLLRLNKDSGVALHHRAHTAHVGDRAERFIARRNVCPLPE